MMACLREAMIASGIDGPDLDVAGLDTSGGSVALSGVFEGVVVELFFIQSRTNATRNAASTAAVNTSALSSALTYLIASVTPSANKIANRKTPKQPSPLKILCIIVFFGKLSSLLIVDARISPIR